MKKMYEAIWEIFNQCPNNQMRDIFIDMFMDLCQSETPDVKAALKEASEQITETCKINYSME